MVEDGVVCTMFDRANSSTVATVPVAPLSRSLCKVISAAGFLFGLTIHRHLLLSRAMARDGAAQESL